MSQIVITSKENQKFTLEFNRRTVEITERNFGVSLTELGNGKISYLPGLFRGAFLMHHPRVQEATVDKLYSQCPDKTALFEALVSMYAESIESLIAEPDEGNAISWEKI